MNLRLTAHLLLRSAQDLLHGTKFARKRTPQALPHTLRLSQPFKPSQTLEQKKQNLSLAARRIGQYTLAPGETFSFWRAVGNPNTPQFACSRSIVAGTLKLERGGGLCQASGIIYHLALLAGLEIVERYAHSVDLYTEEMRFCPLGSDATVAYGYRDLRIRNNTDALLRFELSVADTEFHARLCSSLPIASKAISFSHTTLPDGRRQAIAVDNATGAVLTTDTYAVFTEHA